MSGFDIGNCSCVIAVVKRGEIDVVLNHDDERETPTMVSFGDKQRFVGLSAAANPKSTTTTTTISQIKRLIGKLYKDVKEELNLLPFVTVEGPRGDVLIELQYLKQKWCFTPVEILGMLFTHLKQTADHLDCVIGIPSYFTDFQRRLYIDAASIAGLKPLQLIHDGTAIALGYGMYNNHITTTVIIVMFVDIGQCDTQVTVASFEKGKMNILSHSFDDSLGGRDFDEVLYKHFAAEFNEKYKIDICSNHRASVRLRASCEKVKKVLSANAEAQISIDCLIGDTDVRGVITRQEFENLSAKLLDRIRVPCIMALKDSTLSVDQIYTVELVGSGSRIPAIARMLTSFFQKEPTRTLNASECVARGCALRCAMLSPALHVRDYKVQDISPYSIVIPTPDSGEFVLFEKGCLFPIESTVGYAGNPQFCFEVKYTNVPAGVSPMLGSFQIGGSDEETLELDDVQLRIWLNNHGIVEIGSVRGVKRSTYHLWKMISNNQVVNLPFSRNLLVSTTHDELYEAQKKEKILAEQDLKVEQTKDQRNTLESFVYDTRNKISSAYKCFVTESEKEVIVNSLKETEDWLYEDSDDDDESEQDYTGKLNDLKELLQPIENKYHENARAKAEKALEACLVKYTELAADSLSASKKEMVKIQCIRVENWLNNLDKQHLSPASFPTYINDVIKVFESNCNYIMRSKTYVEPIGLGQADSTQMEQQAESNLMEHFVDSNQIEQPVDLNKSDHPVDSDLREHPLDLEPPVRSDQMGQPVDLDQREQPVGLDEKEQHVDSGQKEQHVDLDQKEQHGHVISDQREQPVDYDQRQQLVQSDQRDQPVDTNQSEQPVDTDQLEQPVGSNQREEPIDTDQIEQFVNYSNQGDQTELVGGLTKHMMLR